MKYMVLMYSNEALAQKLTADEVTALQQDWGAYMKAGYESGVIVGNGGLAPTTTSTTVRVRDGKVLTTDGPFAETHEQLGGYSLLDCKDLDEAVSWAAKIPTARFGSVEIRPLWDSV